MSSKLFYIDNIELMKKYENKYFDLIIADPQYGINATNMSMGSNPNRSRNDGHGSGPGISTSVKLKGRLNSGGGKLKNRKLNQSNFDWDNTPPPKEYFEQIFRISKNQIIFGGNYFLLPPTRCVIVWDKNQPWTNFSQVEIAWTSFDRPAKLYRLSNRGGANIETKIHPTQKPVKLYKMILNDFAKPGIKIFDPNNGSGSLRIAAYDYNIDFTGCDNNKIYIDDSEKRFQEHISQLTLFK